MRKGTMNPTSTHGSTIDHKAFFIDGSWPRLSPVECAGHLTRLADGIDPRACPPR
jgi:hypothetical protein